MENFPANSQKAKDEAPKADPRANGNASTDAKKVEKIVIGEVVRRKKSLSKKFFETFVGGDAKGVGNYVILDVLLPALKDTIADAISQGVEKMLFGEPRSSSRRTGGRPSGSNGYVSYNRYSSSSNRREEPRQTLSRRARANHDFDDIILSTRAEAEEVIDRLFDLVSKYEQATVADLYELVGIVGSYTDDKWGWTDIRGAGATRVSNGYLLDLPRPEHLS